MQSLRQSEKAVKYTFIVGRDMKIIATVNTKLATALFKSKFSQLTSDSKDDNLLEYNSRGI